MDIIVDPRFRDKIPKLTPDEYGQLESNILSDGEIREPLVVWRGRNILIDGHNRWDIYQNHTDDLPFPRISEKDFADEYAAEDWMLLNQLGRRNLNEMQITALRGQLYKARKKTHGGDRGNQYTKEASAQNEHMANEKPKRVSEQLAEQLGVGKDTIKRAEHFVDGLDAAEAVVPGIKDEILSGETKAKKSEVADMRNQTPEQIAETVEELRNPTRVKFPSARGGANRKPTAEELEIAEADKRVLNKNTVVEYGIDDLLEELRNMHDEFFDKYLFTLDIHRDVATDHKGKTLACIKEFETKWKEEVKEIFK